jgi:hypothetical protein
LLAEPASGLGEDTLKMALLGGNYFWSDFAATLPILAGSKR